jgi:hypothetical protein
MDCRVKLVKDLNGAEIEDEKEYTLTTTKYAADGCDGFDCLKNATQLLDEDTSPLLSELVAEFF